MKSLSPYLISVNYIAFQSAFKNMHKYSKQQFEEESDLLSKKIIAIADKLKTAYNNLLGKLNNLQSSSHSSQGLS